MTDRLAPPSDDPNPMPETIPFPDLSADLGYIRAHSTSDADKQALIAAGILPPLELVQSDPSKRIEQHEARNQLPRTTPDAPAPDPPAPDVAAPTDATPVSLMLPQIAR